MTPRLVVVFTGWDEDRFTVCAHRVPAAVATTLAETVGIEVAARGSGWGSVISYEEALHWIYDMGKETA